MKQFKILATSITTHLGRRLFKDEIVGAEHFTDEHITDFLASKSIEEVTEPKPLKKKDNEQTV